jgi:PAS domain S-box-containing protein
MVHPAPMGISFVGASKLLTYVFICLPVALTLSLLLLHLRHSRLIAAEIKVGMANARDILDSSDECIVITNESGKVIRFNQMAVQIFGFEAKNIIGKDFLMLLPDELHQVHQRTMSGSAPDATSRNLEIVARRADGTRFPLSLTVKSVRLNDKPVFLGMCRDITALKRAEASSWKNQQLMEYLLNSSPIVFYTCNIENGYSFTYVSPSIETLFGYKPEAITDAPTFWRLRVHPDDRDQIRFNCVSDLKEGRKELEYRLKLPDGNYRWIADSHTLVQDEKGNPSLLIGRWTDIHERKEAEIKLALKEESLRTSLKYAKLATWGWVINTDEMSFSDQIEEKLGNDKKHLADFTDFCDTIHPEDHDAVLNTFRQCLVEDEALDIECRVLWPDRSVHWIHLMGELINDDSGSPVRMAGVLWDVTAQKKLHVAPLREASQVC